MSGQRAAAEPYTTRFETEVTAVDGRRVWLERSYFYGESGGQPADRGTIGDADVADVQLVDGQPVHVLDEEPSFGVGHRVLCSVDWSFRMYCMRAHTASHALYGAARRLLEDLEYAGFDIDEDRIRIDLETSTEIDDETLFELEKRINRVVWESRPVSWEEMQLSDARGRDDIAFNEATSDRAVRSGRVRVVRIGGENDATGVSDDPITTTGGTVTRITNEGTKTGSSAGSRTRSNAGDSDTPWDVAACSGTHVRNTREIGPVTVLGRSNPGEGVTRIEFAVGPRAIDRRTAEKRAAFAAKRSLETTVSDVPGALDRCSSDRETLGD
ncbi:alanine--tRNA ligase-related protein [Halopiger djelfimassiliensis]